MIFDYLNNGAPLALRGAGSYAAETSVIAPSVLLDDLEVRKVDYELPKLPIVPPPVGKAPGMEECENATRWGGIKNQGAWKANGVCPWVVLLRGSSCSVWEGLRPAKFHEKDRQRGGRIGTVGSGEADDTVDRLRPSLCMVQSVPD